MKISQEMLREMNRQPVRHVQEGHPSFERLVLSETNRMKHQALEKMVSDITEQGEKIAKFRSLQDLAKFKRMIKDFLHEAVYNGLELSEQRRFSADRLTHKMTSVRELDDQLLELTDDVMDQEKKSVDLLGHIGEIEGLLINMYT